MTTDRFVMGAAMLVAGVAGAQPSWAGFIVNSTIFRIDTGTPSNFKDDFASVDYVRFLVNTPGDVVLDMLSWEFDERVGSPTLGQSVDVNKNGRIAFFDTDIVLFREDGGPLSVGNVVDQNDDSPLNGFGDGSIDPLGRDSFLALFLQPGVYVLAISVSDLTPLRAVTGENPIKGEGTATVVNGKTVPSGFGDYRLTVTGDAELLGVSTAPIPLPGSVGLGVLGLAGCGVFAAARRKRRGV